MNQQHSETESFIGKLNEFLEETESPFAVVSSDGVIQIMNQAIAGLSGRTPEAMIGKTYDQLFPADLATTIWGAHFMAMSGERASLDCIAGRPRRSYRVLFSPLRQAGGAHLVYGIVVMAHQTCYGLCEECRRCERAVNHGLPVN